MSDGDDPPRRVLIPIEGLRVSRPWPIGAVVIHPGDSGEDLIRDTPPFATEELTVREQVQTILRTARYSSIAEVEGSKGIDAAIDDVQASLDVLRLFQHHRSLYEPTTFGLPGDIYRSRIEYVAVWDRSAPGRRFRGGHPGYSLSDEAYGAWHDSVAFGFLGSALAQEPPTEGQRRARVGALLLLGR